MNKLYKAIAVTLAAIILVSLSLIVALRPKPEVSAALPELKDEPISNEAVPASAVSAAVPAVKATDTANAQAPAEIVKTIDADKYFYELIKNPKYEMRGVWVATVVNIDMPAGMDAAAFKTWADKVCQNASDKNMNAVVFQVKPTADALYKSELSPWSMYLNAEKIQGKDPGYDPLAIMIESAHSRGLELHAWINPYRVTMASQKLDTLSKDNPAVKHPSWVIGYNNQFYLNPGLPEVREYLVEAVAEIVSNYDVDAIHMDDYFYPYPASGIKFPDDDAFKKYGEGFNNVADWRRSNVNGLVANINNRIKEIKPYVQFGISPFGVWRNIATDPSGSNTRAGVENYDSLYADTRQWLKDGSIDYLAPQIYWSRAFDRANYTVLLDWWNDELIKYTSAEHGGENVHPVNLYVGLADYRVGTKDEQTWQNKSDEISGQISDNSAKEAITGQIHFNYTAVSSNPLNYFDIIKTNNYKSIALTPPTPWNGLEHPAPPQKVTAEAKPGEGILVKITPDETNENTRKYVIYRFAANGAKQYSNDNIAAVVYNKGNTQYLDKTAAKTQQYVYSVRPVSDTGIEAEIAVDTAPLSY